MSIKSKTTDERYTPKYLIEIIRRSLGGVDFDPTANNLNQVNATQYFTVKENCLIREWAKVETAYMNPPFSNSAPFLQKWHESYMSGYFKRGITLTLAGAIFNKRTQDLFRDANFLIIPKGRIEFDFPDAIARNGNDRDVILAFWGEKLPESRKILSQIGMIASI
jgi:phage N-6-adenine-methyltransferase